jgi:hypothetical protein
LHHKSFQNIDIIREKGGNHLPVPPAGCPCPDNGPIPAAPPKTSRATNQYICVLKSHSSLYLFENPYIHVQVLHILHHHTMKLLQRKLVGCRPQNPSAKTILLHALQFRQRMLLRYSQHTFSNKHWFATDNLVSAVNHKFTTNNTTSTANGNSLQTTNFQQSMLILYRQHNFGSESQICYRTYTFSREH